MVLNGTVTTGELLQIFAFLISAFALYNRLSVRLSKVEDKVNIFYNWWWEHCLECNPKDKKHHIPEVDGAD